MTPVPETLEPDADALASPPQTRSVATVLLRNILSNWVGFAIQVAVTFVLTPYVLRAIGQELYGVWAIVTGITGYYGLLDLGLRSGLTQYLTRYLASKDFDAFNRSASTGFFILLGLGATVFLVGVGLSFSLPSLFHLPTDSMASAQTAMAVISLGFAVQFTFFTFSAVLTANQRFDVSNAIGVVTRVTTAAATLFVLGHGGKLIALSWLTTASLIADYGLRCAAAFRLVPELRIQRRFINLASAREFVGYGMWSAVINGGERVISYTDALVIGLYLQAAAVTPFVFASSLIAYFSDFLAPIAQVFFPVFTGFDALSDRAAIRRLYLQASRLMLLLSLSCGLIAWWSAPWFLALWVGPEILSANPWGSAATLFRVLLIGSVVAASQRIGAQVLMATRRVKLRAALFTAEAVVNLGLSLSLIRPLGLLGVTLATTIPALLFNIGVHPYVTCRSIELSLREYCVEVLPRPFLTTLVSGAALYCFRHLLQAPETWLEYLSHTMVVAFIVSGIALIAGLKSEERRTMLVSPARSVLMRSLGC